MKIGECRNAEKKSETRTRRRRGRWGEIPFHFTGNYSGECPQQDKTTLTSNILIVGQRNLWLTKSLSRLKCVACNGDRSSLLPAACSWAENGQVRSRAKSPQLEANEVISVYPIRAPITSPSWLRN